MNITMSSFLESAYELLGGADSLVIGQDTNKSVRYKRHHTYDKKRNTYSDGMRVVLRSAFAGDYNYEKNRDNNLQQYGNTDLIFTHLFEMTEELIFYIQIEYDRSIYNNGTKFYGRNKFYAMLMVINEGMQENKNEYIKTCPLIYLNICIERILAYDYNVTKAAKEVINEKIVELCGANYSNSTCLPSYLNQLDEKKNITKSLFQITREVGEFRTDLLSLIEAEALSETQEDLIKEVQGIYCCMMLLSRLRRKTTPFLSNDPKINLRHIYHYSQISKECRNVTNSKDRRRLEKAHIAFESDDGLKGLYFRTYLSLYDFTWFRQGEQDYLSHIKSEHNNLIARIHSVATSSISDICASLGTVADTHGSIKKVILCLNCIGSNNKEGAHHAVTSAASLLDDAPYSIAKLASLLYIGLSLSISFKAATNTIHQYLDIYLSTSLPKLELKFLTHDVNRSGLIAQSDEENRETLYSLTSLVAEYNKFIIHNKLNLQIFLVNPLYRVNKLFDRFFINFDANANVDGQNVRIARSVRGLKTLIKQATIPLSKMTVLNIEDDFLIREYGLSGAESDSALGCEAIFRFIELEPELRQDIRTAFASVLNS